MVLRRKELLKGRPLSRLCLWQPPLHSLRLRTRISNTRLWPICYFLLLFILFILILLKLLCFKQFQLFYYPSFSLFSSSSILLK